VNISETFMNADQVPTLWGGLTANKVTASPAAVATMLIVDNADHTFCRGWERNDAKYTNQ